MTVFYRQAWYRICSSVTFRYTDKLDKPILAPSFGWSHFFRPIKQSTKLDPCPMPGYQNKVCLKMCWPIWPIPLKIVHFHGENDDSCMWLTIKFRRFARNSQRFITASSRKGRKKSWLSIKFGVPQCLPPNFHIFSCSRAELSRPDLTTQCNCCRGLPFDGIHYHLDRILRRLLPTDGAWSIQRYSRHVLSNSR